MRIVFVEIENFRGIKKATWAPQSGINCLIGPGDSTKTTLLDAIELALNPRSYTMADDYDFYDLNIDHDICITVTIGGLPLEFKADYRYGLHLRGWSADTFTLHDEPGENREDVLSIRVTVDKSLEPRWSLYNERIDQQDADPPMIRYKDMKQLATTRLGPYADRHLGWGRQSVLSQLEDSGESVSLQLAQASRAARQAFREHGQDVFKSTTARVQALSRSFAVPVKAGYKAELDVNSVNVTTGGVTLHDGDLPLRRLGTGSSRLLVSALQHEAANGAHIAMIDEIEYGLEPHRIARLLHYLKTEHTVATGTRKAQLFVTTHSQVVVRELTANDIHTVQSKGGVTVVTSLAAASRDLDKIQAHLRLSPEAFLARRILVGEGKTECGLARGMDAWWTGKGRQPFAFAGAVPIDGGGKDKAPQIAETLLRLGYDVALLLDSDEEPNAATLASVQSMGGIVVQWTGTCSTEERIFRDVRWNTAIRLVDTAIDLLGRDAVLAHLNNMCETQGHSPLSDLTLPPTLDTTVFRHVLGLAAKKKSWFKDITRGEILAELIAPDLDAVKDSPLAAGINDLRRWVDG